MIPLPFLGFIAVRLRPNDPSPVYGSAEHFSGYYGPRTGIIGRNPRRKEAMPSTGTEIIVSARNVRIFAKSMHLVDLGDSSLS